MRGRWIGCLALCALAGAMGVASAGAGEAVRVYTNEDIERLAPLPVQRTPLVPFDKERWEYVLQFLEREHQRLEADRNHDLARAILDAEVEASRRRDERYTLALTPYPGFWLRPHHPGRRRGEPPLESFATPAGQFIAPLHARPSRARLHFDRATRNRE